ncbi:MAG: hypothetical protein KDB22_28400 [Planctomycetales bacterium]|nr:hypothetical protein [Planctomycetales bacterium]
MGLHQRATYQHGGLTTVLTLHVGKKVGSAERSTTLRYGTYTRGSASQPPGSARPGGWLQAWPGIPTLIAWHISVYKINEAASTPTETAAGERIGVWQSAGTGLTWIDNLVMVGNATECGGNGYPTRYAAHCRHIADMLREGPPAMRVVHGINSKSMGYTRTVTTRCLIPAINPAIS